VSNAILKVFAATAVVLALSSFIFDVSAQEKTAVSCKTIKTDAECNARTDCTWTAGSIFRGGRCKKGPAAKTPDAKK
jgi:hypothetical protein